MTAGAVVTRGRRHAEALMVDTCIITAPGAGTTFDPATGEYATNPGAVVYNGKCQVQVSASVPQGVTAGEQLVVLERVTIKIPWDTVAVPINSVVTITAVASVSGADVGTRYRVTGNHDKTYQTATKLPCELVSA